MANMIDNEDVFDMHMCLVCHTTLVGLVNYVNHKKYDCPGKRLMPSVSESVSTASLQIPQQSFPKQSSGINNDEMSHIHNGFDMSTHDQQQYSDNYRNNLQAIVSETGQQRQSVHNSLMSASSHDRSEMQSAEGILKAAMIASGMDIPTSNNSLQSLSNATKPSRYENSNQVGLPPQSSALNSMSTTTNISVDIHDSFSGLTSDMFSPGTTNVIDPNIVMNSHNPEDFFSSLALQSKSSLKEQHMSTQNAVNSILNQVHFDKESSANVSDSIANDLPISNILNNLNFSSDDEDMNFTFSDDDFFEEVFSDDSDDYSHPPRHHTSGKWKPGQGPPQQSGGKWKPGQGSIHSAGSRLHTGGKWKPGHYLGGKWKSTLSQNKVKLKLSVVTKNPLGRPKKSSQTKDGYFCKVCSLYLKNRFSYSSHCASQKHKENVVIGVTHIAESASDGDEQTIEHTSDSVFCKACNLVLKNRFAYSSHCRSKKHRNNSSMEDFYFEKPVSEDEVEDSNIEDEIKNVEQKEENQSEKQEVGGISTDTGQCQKEVVNSEVEAKDTDKHGNVTGEDADNQKSEQDSAIDKEIEERKAKIAASEKMVDENHFDSETDNDEIESEKVNGENVIQQEDKIMEGDKHDEKDKGVDNGKENVVEEIKDNEIKKEGPTTLLICCICDQKFYSKYVLARHFLSQYHKNRAKNHSDTIKVLEEYHKYIVRLSPFQCLVCRFYFNHQEELIKHLSSQDHVQRCEDSSAPLFCTACKFVSHWNSEIVEHLSTHKAHAEAMKRGNRPCIIKEKHYQAKCKYCDKTLHSHVHMKHHIKSKHGKDIYLNECFQKNICRICGVQYKSSSAVKLHVQRKHLTPGQVYCHVCNRIIMGKIGYKRHSESEKHKLLLSKYQSVKNMSRVHKAVGIVNDMKCSQGETNLVIKSDRVTKRKQTEDRVYKCEYCDFVANQYGDLRPHYIDKHSKHVLVCDVCDLTFISEKARKLHYASKQHQGNLDKVEVNKVLKCPLCPKKFNDEGLKNFHVEVYHAHPSNEDQLQLKLGGPCYTSQLYKDYFTSIRYIDKSQKIPCPEKICGKQLKKENMLEHLRLHSGDKPFKCRYCSTGFISTSTLRRHLTGHLGLQQRKCEICGKEYKKIASYREHMQQHELEKNQAQKLMCDVCGQSFYLKRQLQSHMRRHGERKFKCNVEGCHWTFYFATELSFHMRSHTQEKPYLCDLCGYAAATKNRLLRHSRTHSGERLHHCEYCTYKAGTSTHLRRHMRIHIGCKPYKCPYCSYSCNTHENVRKHIMKTKKHSGLYIYPCKFCSYATNAVSEFKSHLMFKHSDRIEITSNDSMAQYTGLYKPQEDPRKPTEGMKINPVKERKQHCGKTKNKNRMKNCKESSGSDSGSDTDELIHNNEHSYSRNNMVNPLSLNEEGDKDQPWVPPTHYSGSAPVISSVISLSSHGHYYGMDGPQVTSHYYDNNKDMDSHYYDRNKDMDDRNAVSLVSLENYPKLVIDEFRDAEHKKTSHFDVNYIPVEQNVD